jgi:hypothetical protein
MSRHATLDLEASLIFVPFSIEFLRAGTYHTYCYVRFAGWSRGGESVTSDRRHLVTFLVNSRSVVKHFQIC